MGQSLFWERENCGMEEHKKKMETIYADKLRTIQVDNGRLVIKSIRGEGRYDLHGMTMASLTSALANSLRNKGINPEGWYSIQTNPANVYAVLPPETREAVANAIASYEKQIYEETHNPANVERKRIAALFQKATQQKYTNPDAYYQGIRAAKDALARWGVQYPKAAAMEKANDMRSEAFLKRQLASKMLTYDADGSLTSENQRKQHDSLIAEADKLEEEATALENE